MTPRTTLTLALVLLFTLAPLVAPGAAALPDARDIGPGPAQQAFIPFVTSGRITDTRTTNNLLSGGGAADAQGQYGSFHLTLTVTAHYVPEGTGSWVQETICTRAVEQANYLGAVALSADCTGSITRTPRAQTGIFYCAEAYLYVDTGPALYGWAMIDGDGHCGSSRIYPG